MWQCLGVILVVTFLSNTDATGSITTYHNTFWSGNGHSHALFPSPALLLARDVSWMATKVFLKEDGQGMEDKLVGDLGNLSVYDLSLVHTCMNILADELEMQVSEHSLKSGIKRIASGQRRSISRNSFGERLSSTGIATEKDANAARLHREALRCFKVFLFHALFCTFYV